MYTISAPSSRVVCALRIALAVVFLVESTRSTVKECSSTGIALLLLLDVERMGTSVSAEAEKERRSVVDCAGEDVAGTDTADCADAGGCAVAAELLKPKRDRKVLLRRACLRMACIRARSRLGGVAGASSPGSRPRCRTWRIKLIVAQKL